MELRCEGCAGCCLDWRPLLADDASDADRERDAIGADQERRGPRPPLDDVANLVPLERDEVRGFLEEGLGDALTPRLWAASDDDAGDGAVTVDGHRLAAVRGRPAFFVGLRKPPKPVAPFDRDDATWLPSCVFLDPTTLQCRIHGDDRYPAECADYPGHNLALEQETECERVEDAFGGRRLLDDDPGDLEEAPLLGPQALGAKVFLHPRPDDLEGVVDRIARGAITAADRAEFVAVAAASSPGTLAISEHHYEWGKERALEADSWVGRACREWADLAPSERGSEAAGSGAAGSDDRGREAAPNPALAERVEDERGAPSTPGWDAVNGTSDADG